MRLLIKEIYPREIGLKAAAYAGQIAARTEGLSDKN